MSVGRLAVYLVIGLFAMWALGNLFRFALGLVFQVVVPLLVVACVGYVVYRLLFRRALTDGSRRSLP